MQMSTENLQHQSGFLEALLVRWETASLKIVGRNATPHQNG